MNGILCTVFTMLNWTKMVMMKSRMRKRREATQLIEATSSRKIIRN